MNASWLIHRAWNRERCGEEMDAAEGISDALENALLPCLALLTYFLTSPSLSVSRFKRPSCAPPFIPSSGYSKDPRKPKFWKKKGEKRVEREREIESFWARMQSRPNEVRKLPNGERRLLLYSSWVPSGEGEGRGKEKCRLSVAFVATGEWRIRAINPVLSLYVYVQCGSYNHEGVR